MDSPKKSSHQDTISEEEPKSDQNDSIASAKDSSDNSPDQSPDPSGPNKSGDSNESHGNNPVSDKLALKRLRTSTLLQRNKERYLRGAATPSVIRTKDLTDPSGKGNGKETDIHGRNSGKDTNIFGRSGRDIDMNGKLSGKDQESVLKIGSKENKEGAGRSNGRPGIALSMDLINRSLSDLHRNLVNGKYTYTKLLIPGKHVNDISILASFIHLRFVDVSNNLLSDLQPLESLQFLQVLEAAGNCIEHPDDVPVCKQLKQLNLARNKLKSVTAFKPNLITHLNLRDNRLESLKGICGAIFPSLRLLDVSRNRLTTLEPIEHSHLEYLYVAENELKSLGGLQNCPMLRSIHARKNKISTVYDFPSLAKLEYLNLRGNRLVRFTQTAYFSHAPNIATLILRENPVAKSVNYRVEMTVAVSRLQRLDKHWIKHGESQNGREISMQRLRGYAPPLIDDPEVVNKYGNLEDTHLLYPQIKDMPPNTAVTTRPLDGKSRPTTQEEEELFLTIPVPTFHSSGGDTSPLGDQPLHPAGPEEVSVEAN